MGAIPNPAARELVEEFVRLHEGYVRGLALRLAPHPAEADDIAQEAFMVAFRKIDALDTSYDIRPWLAATVRNLSRRAWEASMRERDMKRDALTRYVEQLGSESCELYEAPKKEALRRCLEKLPERSRTLLNLRYNLGLRSEDIARQISTSAEAARMALVRIRQRLRACVDQRLEASEV